MPDSEREAELLDAERTLQAAQRAGDVAALDQLLVDQLIAIGPDGQTHTKQDDLDAHRDRTSSIEELVEEELDLLVVGSTGVTFFLGRVAGVFDGAPIAARLRYTRTWVHDDSHGWRVLAAHISPV
ncbi:nuclear transport factor 2 family protein [Micromonospora sp. STR1_7]|uniref:Nuclear transport factor 2 family protein n=1 Tax=Micromonospora parastrephiae TaxID=2806101 RepID=A0ABS1XQ07_9ACTN|nr:nuclear transport factor 2 family protein [Micromonospora parastrephiae]MBM0231345.1 nuclear transport factor 2 family protein [Micromonospora parastrephiae]